ncbi:MAG TPA: methylated-DNA--[protein]-cysteine S-methyltransferase [Candidatus Acidoferrales bacterium]|nr:methylated-DNA--[protein]-cysteine S-methyltransferase [Candidatus Acidoferrales bacterium]
MVVSRRFRPAANTAVLSVDGRQLRAAWTNSGICAVEEESLSTRRNLEHRLRMTLIDAKAPATLRRALATAARGRGDDFPLDLAWTRDFERDVLLAAREIPYGETRSYSWLARQARRPLAVRAAATVMARNPLWLIIPCHRVVYADGRLGPYGSSGQARKRELLEREGVKLDSPRRAHRKRSSARQRTTR